MDLPTLATTGEIECVTQILKLDKLIHSLQQELYKLKEEKTGVQRELLKLQRERLEAANAKKEIKTVLGSPTIKKMMRATGLSTKELEKALTLMKKTKSI